MLDYGDTQMYAIDELYYLDSQFLTLPYQVHYSALRIGALLSFIFDFISTKLHRSPRSFTNGPKSCKSVDWIDI